jgi:hypothetical protein
MLDIARTWSSKTKHSNLCASEGACVCVLVCAAEVARRLRSAIVQALVGSDEDETEWDFFKGRTGRKAFAKRRLFDSGPVFEARHERGVILSGVIGNSFHQMAGRAGKGGGGCFAHSHSPRSSFCGSLTFLYVRYAYGLMNRCKIM